MTLYKKIFKYILFAISSMAFLFCLLILLFIFQPHIPSISEMKFRWKLEGEIDSPLHLTQLTDFKWQRVCIGHDANGWPIDRSQRQHFILKFYSADSKLIDEFYIEGARHNYLELHLSNCFSADSRFFYKL